MSAVHPGIAAGDAIRPETAHDAVRRASKWLCLAAAPSFALMALLAVGFAGDVQPNFFCSAVRHASPLSGMALMYVLMSTFHLPPWLRLIAGQWRA
ncbi:MAG TPA: hypothetical protein VMI30_04020 [Stellaceae bacterium]|nr:hypothetical protein [Stellaceae bacterium]